MKVLWKCFLWLAIIGCLPLLFYLYGRYGHLPWETDTFEPVLSTKQFHGDNRPITLFTTWATYPGRFEVYNNTLGNWPLLKSHVNLILFTNDDIPDRYKHIGWTILPIKRYIKGHPVLKDMFMEAMQQKPFSKLYAFSNGDLLFTDTFVKTLDGIFNSQLLNNKTYLVVGRRMNTPNVTRTEASSWEGIGKAAKRGELMNENWGIDYFMTSPMYHWPDIPEVQIGQNFYDNWLVLDARRTGYAVIDTTETLLAVHQNAPYRPGPLYMDNNLKYINDSRLTLYRKGVIPCCEFHTVFLYNKVKLIRRLQIPETCIL